MNKVFYILNVVSSFELLDKLQVHLNLKNLKLLNILDKNCLQVSGALV